MLNSFWQSFLTSSVNKTYSVVLIYDVLVLTYDVLVLTYGVLVLTYDVLVLTIGGHILWHNVLTIDFSKVDVFLDKENIESSVAIFSCHKPVIRQCSNYSLTFIQAIVTEQNDIILLFVVKVLYWL